MLPHLGNGASQGIEDGYLLAKLLASPSAKLQNIEVSIHDAITNHADFDLCSAL